MYRKMLTMNQYTDRELAQSITPQTKQQIFSELYKRHADRVYRFAYSRCGHVQASEDIVSETFIAFWHVVENFDGKSQLSTFIIGIALNKLRQYYQRQGKELSVDADIFLEDLDDEDIENDQAGVKPEVKTLLAKLPENYRRLLQYKFIDGKTTLEIANIMGITADNVRQLQRRALNKAAQLSLEGKNYE